MAAERLYIKVILKDQAQEQKKPGGGKAPTPFKKVTPQFRQKLISSVGNVEQYLQRAPSQSKIVPARVTLEKKAQAKTHRPTRLFSADTCPIIGAGKPGELFVKMSPGGANALRHRIRVGISPHLEKAISTVREIAPIEARDRLAGIAPDVLFETAPKDGEHRLFKVTLFDYGNPDEQDASIIEFETLLFSRDIPGTREEMYKSQDVYTVRCKSADEIAFLSNAVMVRGIARVPVFRTLRDLRLNPRPMPTTLQKPCADPTDFPIVAVVDSGVSSKMPGLEEWVHKHLRFVAEEEENIYHGTFVAGLIVWGDELNSSLPEIGAHPCRVLDVHVLPNSDPSSGNVGVITEIELLNDLEGCLKRYANEVKVWNLSLGSDEVCQLDKFSDFAMQLDNLQEQYGVTFVVAAGNYQESPLLKYPRSKANEAKVRITTPADSVLAVSVGSISQIDHPSTGGRRGEPSPFSRNGPGPNFTIKPDLVHFGGNIGLDHSLPLGITSLGDGASVGENVGTSFSAPLIARQLAYVHHQITPAPSTTLARALLTHNARDLRTLSRVEDGDDRYLGFGIPLNIDRALECQPWQTTLVFEETLRPGYVLEWDNFPYPDSLKAGKKSRGEIWMTLAYPPKRNPAYGSEYCETYIEAHFGVIRDGKDKKTKQPKEIFKGLVPPEHNSPGELFESFQVERLRKWAPVRTYHTMIPNGVIGKRWKLMVNMLTRHDVEKLDQGDNQSSVAPILQPFALILTISDPERRSVTIYDEMARILRTRFKSRNLQLRPTVEVRART
jgi:serine protease AprX